MMSSDEAEEYKKTTLTGANVPYSYKDPRQEISDGSKIDISEGTMLPFSYIHICQLKRKVHLSHKSRDT